MAIISKAISYVDKNPGTTAILGFIGVAIFASVDFSQMLLYVSLIAGVIGLLIRSSRESTKSKKAKRTRKRNKDYIL